MPRVTASEVEQIVETNPDDGIAMAPFIAAANALVNYIVACATALGKLPDDSTLKEIERWLSAHFYGVRDQQYASRSTGGASGQFQGQTAMNLNATIYGQQAMMLDSSNCLAARVEEVMSGSRKVVSLRWLGKTRNNELTYEERNGTRR